MKVAGHLEWIGWMTGSDLMRGIPKRKLGSHHALFKAVMQMLFRTQNTWLRDFNPDIPLQGQDILI
jgi:hypothetical protein